MGFIMSEDDDRLSKKVAEKIAVDRASVRKRLALKCFYAPLLLTLGVVLYIIFKPDAAESIDTISEIVIAFNMMCLTITGTYVGVSSWQEIKYRQRQP